MNTNQENNQNPDKDKKIFKRKEEDLLLKKQLLLGADALITPRESDENLDRLYLKVKLIGGDDGGVFSEKKLIEKSYEYYSTKYQSNKIK